MTDEYTVLIQGPLEETFLQEIEYYKTLGRVIICTWKGQDVSLLDGVTGISVIERDEPTQRRYKQPTFDHQAWSLFYGLEIVGTPYVIRTRTDERWGNLAPLLERFEQDREKIVCGNIFFKTWRERPFHFGDHLFVGRTDRLLAAYRDLLQRPELYSHFYCAEQSASNAMLIAGNTQPSRQSFEALFDVIDLNELVPFRVQWRGMGTEWIDNFRDPDGGVPGSCIKSMEEL